MFRKIRTFLVSQNSYRTISIIAIIVWNFRSSYTLSLLLYRVDTIHDYIVIYKFFLCFSYIKNCHHSSKLYFVNLELERSPVRVHDYQLSSTLIFVWYVLLNYYIELFNNFLLTKREVCTEKYRTEVFFVRTRTQRARFVQKDRSPIFLWLCTC
jgi:hypothetical protein